jgi:hypothetical protein
VTCVRQVGDTFVRPAVPSQSASAAPGTSSFALASTRSEHKAPNHRIPFCAALRRRPLTSLRSFETLDVDRCLNIADVPWGMDALPISNGHC